MLLRSSGVPALNTATEPQSLTSTGSRVSKVPDCQTPHLLNKVVVDRGSVKTRIMGDSSIELADEFSPILASVKDKTSKTGQSSGPATVASPKHTEYSFKCSVCNATCRYRSILKMHMKKHNDERPYSCMLCPRAFKHKFHLNRHMRECHGSAYEFECPVCTRKFETDTNLQNHMDTHKTKTDKPFPCPDCPRTYALEKSLNRNKRKHNSDCLVNKVVVDHGSVKTRIMGDSSIELADEPSPIPVSVKDKTSKTGQSSGPATVASPKHTEYSFKCSVCNATCRYRSTLKMHMKKHNDECPYSCILCSRAFKYKFNLNRHMQKFHNSAYEFECPVCTRKFETDTNLQNHMDTHKTKTDKPFPCSDCPRTYALEKSLNRNKRKHNSDCLVNKVVVDHGSVKTRIMGDSSIELADEPSPIPVSVKDKTSKTGQSSGPATVASPKHTEYSFKCSVCNATCRYRSTLKMHMKKHNDECPYSCILCSRAFKYKFNLNRHMQKFHNSAYEFECPVCTRKFETDANLQNHMDTHKTKTDKPFSCPDCPKIYVLKGSLNRHKRKHNSDCQMTCPVCSMVFYQENTLLRHSYRHSEGEKSKCDFCGNDHRDTGCSIQQHIKIICNLRKTKTTKNHQPSANSIGVNEPSIQKEHEEIFEKTLSLLRELQDPFPAMPSRESAAPSCDDLFSRQEMPAEILPGRQNADGDPVIKQSHAMIGRLSAGGIGVNEPSIQEEHEETFEETFEETLRLLHELQNPFPTMPS